MKSWPARRAEQDAKLGWKPAPATPTQGDLLHSRPTPSWSCLPTRALCATCPCSTKPTARSPSQAPGRMFFPMLIHSQIDPVASQLGPVAVRWYGLTYLVAFGLFLFLGSRRLRHAPFAAVQGGGAWSFKDVEDILFPRRIGRSARRAHRVLPVYKPRITPPIRWRCCSSGRAA